MAKKGKGVKIARGSSVGGCAGSDRQARNCTHRTTQDVRRRTRWYKPIRTFVKIAMVSAIAVILRPVKVLTKRGYDQESMSF